MPDAPKSTVSETPTLESSLLKEIEKTGFPAEIISAGYFRDAEWLTLDHSYYIDRDENKGREIDALVAKEFVASNDRRELKLHLGLAVEVKTSRQKPWVVFSSTKASTEQVSDLFETRLVRLHLQEIWFKDLYETHPVGSLKRLGRIAHVALRKAESEESSSKSSPLAFSAFTSCFKAVGEFSAHYSSLERAALRNQDGLKSYGVGIGHGVVVLDGKLFDARVGRDKTTAIEERDQMSCVYNYASEKYGYRKLLIDIVTLGKLQDYISGYERWAQERAQWCLEQLS